MLRIRFSDGPRKGQIAEVDPAAGWAMLKDGRATDPRVEVPAPSPVAEVAAAPIASTTAAATGRTRRGSRS